MFTTTSAPAVTGILGKQCIVYFVYVLFTQSRNGGKPRKHSDFKNNLKINLKKFCRWFLIYNLAERKTN